MADYQSLTVKFGANTTEFDNSIKGVNKALRGLKKDFGNINRQLRFNPDSVDLLERKLENLQQQAELGADKIKKLKKQQDDLGAENIGGEEWQKLQLEIEKVETQMASVGAASQRTEKQLQDLANPRSVLNLDKAINQVKADLETVNKKLKLNPNDTNATQRKFELLATQVGLAEMKVESLRKEQANLGKDKIGTAEWKKLDAQIVDAELDVVAFRREQEGVAKSSGIAFSKIDTTNLMIASQYLGQIGDKLKEVGTKAVETYKEIDDSMDVIVQKTGESKDAYEEFYDAIAKEVPVNSFNDIGASLGEVRTQFDLSGQELQKLSTDFLKFAQINNSDVTSSIQEVKKVLDLWGLSTADAVGVMDTLTKVSQNTGISVETLSSNLQNNYGTLQRLGLSVGESADLLGRFAKGGRDASSTMTALKKATSTYAKEGKDLKTGLRETSEQIKNAKTDVEALGIAEEVFGSKQASSMVDAIKSGKLNLEDFGLTAEETSGTVNDAFEKTIDASERMQIATQEMDIGFGKFGEEIANTLAPILEFLAETLQKVATWFSSLSQPVKDAITIFGMLITAILTLTPIIVGVVSFISTLSTAVSGLGIVIGGFSLTLAPLVGIVLGVVAAITGIIVVIKNWGAITEWISEKVNSMKESVVTRFNTIRNGITTVMSSIVNKVKGGITSVIKLFSALASKVMSKVGNFKSVGKKIIDGIINGLVNLPSRLVSSIKNAFSSAKSSLGKISFSLSKDYGNTIGRMTPSMVGATTMTKAIGGYTTNNTNSLNISVNANNSSAQDIAKAIERSIVRSNIF